MEGRDDPPGPRIMFLHLDSEEWSLGFSSQDSGFSWLDVDDESGKEQSNFQWVFDSQKSP